MENTYEKLQKLMNSYVPEFAYERDGKDPGSVLTDLCGGMIDECAKRYEQVIPKHRVQYLNLFDSMLKEPVSASKGYVQFHPVDGTEEMILVPAGTRVLAADQELEEIVFETEHDMTVSDTSPQLIAVTDRSSDRIVVRPYDGNHREAFYAFDVRGENRAEHRLYLGFDELFSHLDELDFYVFAEAFSVADQQELLEVLSSDSVCWAMLDPDEGEKVFPQAELQDGKIHLRLEGYEPKKTVVGQREGYYLTLSCTAALPKLYIRRLEIGFARECMIPREV